MYFLHRVEIDPYRRRAAQPRSPARENFRRRVNHAFIAGNSYPAPGSVRGYPCVQLRLLRIHLRRRLPYPASAFVEEYPYSSGTPTPPAPSQGYPDTPSAAPPPPAPSAKDTQTLLRPPPPRPRRGSGVRARAYIRGAAVPGSSPGSPRALDRGDIAIGGGADGEGELVPPPLFLTLQPSCFPSIPPQPLAGDSYTSPATPPPAPPQGYPDTSPAPPTPPAPSALLPRPRLGAGSVPGSSPGSPRALDRGGHRYWERRPAGRRRSPPPVSYASRTPHIAPTLPISPPAGTRISSRHPRPGLAHKKTLPGICNS